MGQDSKIEWCHHRFNPWRGCTKISAGRANCYADTLSKRNPKTLGVWGPRGTRVVAADAAWREPLKWNRLARDGLCHVCGGSGLLKGPQGNAGLNKCPACNGVPPGQYRARVFCASLADVFEGPETMPAEYETQLGVERARTRLFNLIRQTPHLDWLLLTKRPEHIGACIGGVCRGPGLPDEDADAVGLMLQRWMSGEPPANVWLGTSVEDQATADQRISHLLRCPAAVRFLSCEPLLGPIDLNLHRVDGEVVDSHCESCDERHEGRCDEIHWVIVGGESGPNARPMRPAWAQSIRDQCVAADVSFHFKQWGEHLGGLQDGAVIDGRQYLNATDEPDRVGKRAAGRLLDGRTWDEFPAPAAAEATRA